jgi:pyruvate dehydrogenase E2 component (dihydrolipoamide acetyltransferase)
MATPIILPRLGWNMEEGVFVGWLKQDGDTVRPGDALFSLEGEKATQDVESLDGGVLRIAPDGPRPGATLPVGAVLGYLVEVGEPAPFESAPEGATVKANCPAETSPGSASAPPTAPHTGRAGRRTPAASPRARRVARELGVDWTALRGSGRSGRVRERDVRAAAATAAPPRGTTAAPSPVRRTIAGRMAVAGRAAAVTLTTTADAANLVRLREQFKAAAGGGEPAPGYTDFLVKLAAAALARHPALNAAWADGQIVTYSDIHIGIAVDTDAGLFVPVVRDVPALTLTQVAARSRALAERARQRRLTAAEAEGGTFTVTNLGAYGVDAFTPIPNPPQCAVLGVGRVQRRPAVRGNKVVARPQLTLSLTFDHRVVDGAPAARFLQTLTGLVECPAPALIP